MDEINNIDYELSIGKNRFRDKVINLGLTSFFENSLHNASRVEFIDCIFNGNIEINDLNNPNLSLHFTGCTFNGEIIIDSVKWDNLYFIDLKKILRIEISGDFNRLKFKNNTFPTPLEGSIYIADCNILKEFNFDNFHLFKGDFTLEVNNLKDNYDSFSSSFKKAIICNGRISQSFLGNFANFRQFNTINDFVFDECEFNKSTFTKSSFGKLINFNNCKFHSYIGLEECRDIEKTYIRISSCLFKSFPHFNKSKFEKIEILHTTFERKVSFDSVKCSVINLYQVTFIQGAFFDDLQINNLEECDRKTIRTIKQEIQKTENKIDYNRFRVYEFNAYRKDISLQLKTSKKSKKRQLKRDLFVLNISEFVSDYGTDWKRALKFTTLYGFLLYLFLYFIENYNYTMEISNWNNWTRFTSGLFRFFLVTDFFNPLDTDRVYLTNPFSWSIFIIGKIVIAFGIYEMIQSFRKFKA